MICTSIQNKELIPILDVLESGEVELAEIRLDRCPLEDEDIETLFSSSDVPLIATCRLQEEEAAPALLEMAIRAGAKYVDLEMEAPAAVGRRIREACREWGSVLIRSYHDFSGTPPLATLRSLLERARAYGGEVVKIVTTATCEADNETIKALYKEAAPGTLIAFCMGEMGRASRLEALRQGAPFTYACLTEEEATAPGQWTTRAMREAVYGGFRFIQADGLPMPSSKSFAQRAIVAAALAEGTSRLSGYSPCGDNESALAVARALGATVEQDGNILIITGIGAFRLCLKMFKRETGEGGFIPELRRVMVVGAGDAGSHIIEMFSLSREGMGQVVCLVDDDPAKQGLIVNNVKVSGTSEDIPALAEKNYVTDIIIAIPTLTEERSAELYEICLKTGCFVRTLDKMKALESE